MAPLILHPSKSLHAKDLMLAMHKREIELAIGLPEVTKKPEVLKLAKNVVAVEDIHSKMTKYAKRNRRLFNPS